MKARPTKVVTVIAGGARLSVTALERIIALADLEALGVIDVSRVILGLPTVPRRAGLIVRDVVIVLAQMPARDERPWHDFHDGFTRTHTAGGAASRGEVSGAPLPSPSSARPRRRASDGDLATPSTLGERVLE